MNRKIKYGILLFCLLFFISACKKEENKVLNNAKKEEVKNYEGKWILDEEYLNGKPQKHNETIMTLQKSTYILESTCRILGGMNVTDNAMIIDIKKSSCPSQDAYIGEKKAYTYSISEDLNILTIWTAKEKSEVMYVYRKEK